MQVLNAVFGIVLARRLSQDDYGLIGFGLVQSLRDIVPFALISGAAVLGAYFATLGVGNVYVLFVCRVLLAAVLYLGLMWVCGAKILRECLAFVKLKF